MHRTKRIKFEAFPCRVCLKNCENNQSSICCDLCNCWLHTDCINLPQEVLDIYKKETDLSFYCSACALDGRSRYVMHYLVIELIVNESNFKSMCSIHVHTLQTAD